MKAFWWFKENSIAGMARVGFNHVRWFELPFPEAAVMGWIGQHSSGTASLESYREHLRTYVPKLFKFYKVDQEAGREAIEMLRNPKGFLEVLGQLNERSQILGKFEIADDSLQFEMNQARLAEEIAFLKIHGIQRVISLTEEHHGRDLLQETFALHHIGIADLGAPQPEQVYELAQILAAAQKSGEKIAVHCLAGIGRTSTMLLAAHIALGESFDDLKALIARQNPSYVLSGPQEELIRSFHERSLKPQAVAAIIKKDSRFLLGRRSQGKRSAPGFWSPVAGRIELGETEAQAVVRECDEEVGLVVRAVRKVTEFDINEGSSRLHWWLVEVLDGKEYLKNDEHTELRWFTIDEMKREPGIFPEDIEVFSSVLESPF